MSASPTNDCIVAISSAPGVGALAVIRLSGQDVFNIVSKVFTKNLEKVESHTIHYGHIKIHGETIDEVLISVFRAPRSFTSEDSVEISCHGSKYIQKRIIEILVETGVRLAKPGEFSMRAFLHGRMDLTQAEAITDLITAGNQRAHELALHQMKGGFSKAISQLREELIHFASMIELELDFGEEDVEFADRNALVQLIQNILSILNPLMDSFKLGNAIKNGIKTVIAGRPNAGKSTLLNALLNEERAIVSEIAGTTRDTIEEVLNIEGVEFRLIDTAGIREARDTIEAIGVERTMKMVKSSAILIYVFDLSEMSHEEVGEDLKKLQQKGTDIIVIANKADKSITTKGANWKLLTHNYKVVSLSAKEKQGLDALRNTLYDIVDAQHQSEDAEIVANVRHYESLFKTKEALDLALENIQVGTTGDIVALDIRHAIRHLGEITGEITTDDLLDNIFSRFCIGK